MYRRETQIRQFDAVHPYKHYTLQRGNCEVFISKARHALAISEVRSNNSVSLSAETIEMGAMPSPRNPLCYNKSARRMRLIVPLWCVSGNATEWRPRLYMVPRWQAKRIYASNSSLRQHLRLEEDLHRIEGSMVRKTLWPLDGPDAVPGWTPIE